MIIKRNFTYGEHQVTLETGKIAKQATGAVCIQMGDTALLTTVVVKENDGRFVGFLPLTVVYQERTYAVGKIPGGYFKREGRATERETLISRLIDRAIRPLFPKGFDHEVQVIITLLSSDEKIEPDVPALLSVSAALNIAGIPLSNIIGAARIGYVDGEYLLNPNAEQLLTSSLNLMAAGTRNAIVMVESSAKELNDETMLGALKFAHHQMQPAIDTIMQFVEEVKPEFAGWEPLPRNETLEQKVLLYAAPLLTQYLQKPAAQRLKNELEEIKTTILEHPDILEASGEHFIQASKEFDQLYKNMARETLLKNKSRFDGRDFYTVRPISIRVGLLPRVHGSALFTRGETQALVTATLGGEHDAQRIDDMGNSLKETFMLHYNFPPFCVGETGPMFGPKRREIGHGNLAKMALKAVLPDSTLFPYTLRLVSEILESNGSSSMATICGGSLALMDAGVPITKPVAGIAMGLIKDKDQFAILSDINEKEDHLGDMDFKIAGTDSGITALQMDIKIEGVSEEIIELALKQAREGCLHILSEMENVLPASRNDLSVYAPHLTSFSIDPKKIRDLIGKGGITIRGIAEATTCTINVDDTGKVSILAPSKQESDNARQEIDRVTKDIMVGEIYEGIITKLADFGVFVNLTPGKDGLLHISQISEKRIESIEGMFVEGDVLRVKVMEINQEKIRLTMKNID